jgi:hypothetical protein
LYNFLEYGDNILNFFGGEASLLSAQAFGDGGSHFLWVLADREDREHRRGKIQVDLMVEDWVFRHGDGALQGTHEWGPCRGCWSSERERCPKEVLS